MKQEVIKALAAAKIKIDNLEELIEVPKNPDMGDYALPCFSLAKELKKSPQEIAKDIASKIKSKDFEKIEAAGPYVNFFVNKSKLAEETITQILTQKEKYGSSSKGKRKAMVEFSQPNTHKAFHVGHIRGTSFGESLARIMEFSGDKVTRANYSGDTGMHIAKWIWCYNKYHSKEKLTDNELWIANIYVDAVKRLSQNEELQKEVNEINKKLDERSDKELLALWQKTRKLSIDSWKGIYKELGNKFDVHYFESEVEEDGKKIAQDLVKKGVAEISEGATIMQLEEYKMGVWVLLRSDGTVLYSAKDLALAKKKFEDFDLNYSVTITANEQDLHFRQLIKTLELMKFKHHDEYKHLSYGTIRLPTGKMSSRTGDNIIYTEFKEELTEFALDEIKKRFPELKEKEAKERALAIAIASMKYAMLKQDSNKNIIFDKNEAMRFEGDTGPYLLYSYARANSIMEKAKVPKEIPADITVNEHEKRLISELGKFPEVVQSAYTNFAPNLVANYAFQLCQTFNEFYHECKVIGSEEEKFRLLLVKSFSITLKNALSLLAIPVIEKM